MEIAHENSVEAIEYLENEVGFYMDTFVDPDELNDSDDYLE
jgi:hypothetical protein